MAEIPQAGIASPFDRYPDILVPGLVLRMLDVTLPLA